MSSNLLERHVVTYFLESDGETLLLRRSRHVGSYQGRWTGVSGYVEIPPDEQAVKEIKEETVLQPEDIHLVRKGGILAVEDEELGVRRLVHPYLFHITDRGRIRTDWERLETKWILPEEISDFTTVSYLKDTLDSVYPG